MLRVNDRKSDAGARERTANASWLRALERTSHVARNPHLTLPAVIDDHARRIGDAPALISEFGQMSYRAVAALADRYAQWALAQGLAKDDVVCLLMPNRPEFMTIWLGLAKVGCTVALINTNLNGKSLAHCIDIVNPRHVIVDNDCLASFQSARSLLRSEVKTWHHGDGQSEFARIEEALVDVGRTDATVLEERRPCLDDVALYIYTSGTTGLPKAARVSHRRVMLWSCWLAGMMDAQPTDRMYNCLPMYHSIGGVAAPGAMLVAGGSIFIRERFSVRKFWDDVVSRECTLFQYIGELCRYLVNGSFDPRETQHRLRLCCGNGMRPDVWETFQRRFQIPRVLEFYAATESNISLYNAEGRPGAIGRIPLFLAHRFPLRLIKIDPNTGLPLRDERGLCVACGLDEPGEALGRIAQSASEPGSRFEGYTSRVESAKKVVRDVVEPGDAWFRSGDMMRKDAAGYYYFVDRMGDTFRWKGENVATTEVAEALAAFPGVRDATVYGVTIPGYEGRAGMAALATEGAIELAALRAHIAERLPTYARPLFLRMVGALEVTSTFKHMKSELMQQGFDPSLVEDEIYLNDPEQQAFVRVDCATLDRIRAGAVRF